MVAAPPSSAPVTAAQTSPPPQSRYQLTSRHRAIASPSSAPRLGATDIRQMARSVKPASGAASQIACQNALEASSSRVAASQSPANSANTRSRRKLTDGIGPSRRNAVTPGTPESEVNSAVEEAGM